MVIPYTFVITFTQPFEKRHALVKKAQVSEIGIECLGKSHHVKFLVIAILKTMPDDNFFKHTAHNVDVAHKGSDPLCVSSTLDDGFENAYNIMTFWLILVQ